MQILARPGPYTVAEVVPGQKLTLKRDPNYWARDLPGDARPCHFDEIRIDYFQDAAAMFEAFKAGLYDFHRGRSDSLARGLRLSRRARWPRGRA